MNKDGDDGNDARSPRAVFELGAFDFASHRTLLLPRRLRLLLFVACGGRGQRGCWQLRPGATVADDTNGEGRYDGWKDGSDPRVLAAAPPAIAGTGAGRMMMTWSGPPGRRTPLLRAAGCEDSSRYLCRARSGEWRPSTLGSGGAGRPRSSRRTDGCEESPNDAQREGSFESRRPAHWW